METFASLREYKIVRINENKDRFIQKNTLLTDEQKKEVLDFFHSHANLEAKVNNGNWNYNIPYEEFKKVIDSVDTEEKRLKKQTKELRKSKGLEGLVEGEDYTITADTPEYIAYTPKNHKAMRVIASNMVEPKLWCRSSVMEWSPKEILPEGEPMKDGLYPGAKWCVAMERERHWKDYTGDGWKFVVVCSKDPKIEESLKKVCLVYSNLGRLSKYRSVTASDTSLEKVQSDYIDAVIKDLEGTTQIDVLKELQKCYSPRSKAYRLSRRIITPQELMELGKLDHPVTWVGNFEVPGNATSLEGCPDKITGDFDCNWCSDLTSLKGAPKHVGKDFKCNYCHSLTSLEGAPEYIGRNFDCSYCKNLTSLEGAPKRVEGSFDCYCCKNLTSLEGAPEYVGGAFSCARCESLTSLKGAPKYVKGYFSCYDCGKPFSKEDVQAALSHV